MSHARKVIRDYVAAQLVGLGISVHIGKVWLEDLSDIPAINIMTPDESRSDAWEVTQREAPATYPEAFDLTTSIEVRDFASDNILDKLDGWAAQIQAALADSLRWGGNVKMVRYVGMETEIVGTMSAPVGVITLAYDVQYRTNLRDPSTPTE